MQMLQKAIEISLIITAIHVSMWTGMLFYRFSIWLSQVTETLKLEWLRKPLFECLICMGGIWTLIIYPILYGWSWKLIPVMLMVIGMNTLIDKYIHLER